MASHESSTNHGPRPSPSTEKTYFQSRQGVVPTNTPNLGFNSSAEGSPRAMDSGANVMGYTGINGSEPSAMEKGIPTAQKSKGG